MRERRILSGMRAWGIISGLVMALAGVAVLYVARLGAEGRLRRNFWAGLRLPSTLRSDEAWRAAAAPSLRWAGWAALLGGVIGIAVLPLDNPVLFAAALILGAVGLVAAITVSTVAGVRAARRS